MYDTLEKTHKRHPIVYRQNHAAMTQGKCDLPLQQHWRSKNGD